MTVMGAEKLIEEFANNPNTKYPHWQRDAEIAIIKSVATTGRFQKIYTPGPLCESILDKLCEYIYIGNCNKIAVLFNVEFVISAIRHDAKPENIWFFSDSEYKGRIVRDLGVNVVDIPLMPSLDKGDDKIYQMLLQHNEEDAEKFLEFKNKNIKGRVINMAKIKKGMKFDVVIMNPPYQAPQVIKNEKGITGGGSTLWDKFLETAIEDMVKDDGYVVSINPSGYRTPNHRLWNKIKKGIRRIEMHDHKEGQRVFGKGTRFDELVYSKNGGGTKVVDEDGNSFDLDLDDWSFLPNGCLELFEKLIAKDGEKRLEILHSYSDYETRKPWMSREKHDKYKYPCIYMINSKNEPTFYWSSKKDAHFGVPKVIFVTGCSSGFMLDLEGKYGLTQFARGIINDQKNLEKIYDALMSEKWKVARKALFIAENSVSKDAMACLRKDFWKEFI